MLAAGISRPFVQLPMQRFTPNRAVADRPAVASLSPTLWQIDDDAFANHAASDQFEFEFVIAGLTWLRRQQPGTSLNVQGGMSGTANIGIPHLAPGLGPTSANELFSPGLVVHLRSGYCVVAGRFGNSDMAVSGVAGNAGGFAKQPEDEFAAPFVAASQCRKYELQRRYIAEHRGQSGKTRERSGSVFSK
jgi:hypothetical protein